MQRKATALLLVAAAAVLCLPAAAAVLRVLYLDEIASRSAVIVDAKIVSASSDWNDRRTSIETTYTAQAIQYVKGSLGDTFQFHEPGGQAGGLQMVAPGTPQFSPGQEVLLLLWSDPRSGRYQCIGLTQGALYVSVQNGTKYVDRAIPVRPGTTSVAALLGSRPNATSRQLDVVMSQLAVAAALAPPAGKEGK